MANFVRSLVRGFMVLAFSSVFLVGAMAQSRDLDLDAKIKRLEALEARVDGKLKRLESLEVRLESRLETGVQPVAFSTQTPVLANGNVAAAIGMTSALAAGAGAPREKELWGGQISFRGGYTHLDKTEQSPLFSGSGTGKNGWMVGGALDIPLLKDPFFNNTLLGQISMDFSGINGRTSRLLGAGDAGRQALYKIAISPKYRIDTLGDIRPWIIPIGLTFLVNSPPSNSAAYLTVGGTTGAGVEYVIMKQFSLGAAMSYNFYSRSLNHANTNHLSVGPYVGINF
jgi:opacity protein-like surface antigen